METTLEPDWRTLGVLGAARDARGAQGARLGTEHLLAAVAAAKGPAGEALAAAGADTPVLLAALRARRGAAGWAEGDDAGASVPSREVLGATGERGDLLSGAAARALAGAMERARLDGARKFTAEHLLRALLADGRATRATELLHAVGAAPRAVLERLDAVEPRAVPPGPGAAPGPAAGLDPLLRPTRDALLARGAHPVPRWRRLLTPGAPGAAAPAGLLRAEADAQAERLGRRAPGTEHVLLALLAVHEVSRRQPELAVPQTADDGGGAAVAGLGVDYARVHAALTAGQVPLAADPRSVEAYLSEAGRGRGTNALVRALLAEDTRARRLVEALGGGRSVQGKE
ncbi:Clp protease N-terminal domain-containing protein [Kitasatospora sp. NPDC101176]|uniref:Clp protease N-terminal domain-containing protein n=1 Tax=Kitasatospora sp. NPDC101176 TaxID=3364099 RepID=UPI00380E5EF9